MAEGDAGGESAGEVIVEEGEAGVAGGLLEVAGAGGEIEIVEGEGEVETRRRGSGRNRRRRGRRRRGGCG